MPRKSPGRLDSRRIIWQRTLSSSSPYGKASAERIHTSFRRGSRLVLEPISGSNPTRRPRRNAVYRRLMFREHHGVVAERDLVPDRRAESGSGGVSFLRNYPGPRWPKPPVYRRSRVNHSPRSGCGPMGIRFPVSLCRSRPTPGFVIGEPLLPSKSALTIFGMRATCHRQISPKRSSGSFRRHILNPKSVAR